MTAEVTAVTGATGFLGRHLCSALASRGIAVRGLVRTTGALPAGIQSAPIRDLEDRDALRAGLAGADRLIHLAGRVHVMKESPANGLAEFRRVNVEGTRILLEEARAAGVRRFVFISSVKAVGETTEVPWTEETPTQPLDGYGVSKLEAERLVAAACASGPIEASILRLPLVYGPGMRANMLRLMEVVDRGLPLPFGAVRNSRSLAYVGNVVAAIEAVLGSGATAGQLFFVSDQHDLSTPDLIRAMAAALERPARLLPVPPALFRLAGAVGDRLRPLLPVPVTSEVVQRLLGSLVIDSSKLTRMTGFRPRFTLAEGLRATAEWFRARPVATS